MDYAIRKLNALGTLSYVLAAFGVPASCVVPVLMLRMSSAAHAQARTVLLLAAGGGLVGSLLLVGCIVLLGRALRTRRWWTFCFTASVFLVPAFPFGTALGIFTLLTLNKPEVKKLFARAEAGRL